MDLQTRLKRYDRICESYTLPEKTDIIAIIEYADSHTYKVWYNPYTSPCDCGPFYNLLDAQENVKRLRPTAVIAEPKEAIYEIIPLGSNSDSCRIVPVNRCDKELMEIAGGGGCIVDMRTMLATIKYITKTCDKLNYKYKFL